MLRRIALFHAITGLATAWLCVTSAPAEAKARLVAVAPLRSTADLSATASTVAKDLVTCFGAIVGYDGMLLASPLQGRAVDAAAAAGATIYVGGQITNDGGTTNVSVASFDVGTDHQIASLTFALVGGHVPANLDVSSLVGSQPGANAAAVPGTAGTIVLVPFEMPDNKDTQLEFATTEFVKKMLAKGKTLVQSPAMDHVEAASQVPALCRQFGASGVLIGTARHEQRLNFLLGSYPTHTEVRVTQLDCSGNVVWKGFGTGDVTYYWSNAGAAVSDTIDRALDTVVSQYVDAAAATPPPK